MTRRPAKPTHGGARPGAGRPVTTGRTDGTQRQVRLTAAEDRTIRRAAKYAGSSPAEYLRSTGVRVAEIAEIAQVTPDAVIDTAADNLMTREQRASLLDHAPRSRR